MKKVPVGNVTCVVSRRFRFIALLIAKNASSTIREEFKKPLYDSFEQRYSDIDPELKADYFTFAFLRHPVSRLLSAYRELSHRIEIGFLECDGLQFWRLDDGPDRFATFVEEIETLMPEPHVRRQVEYVRQVRVEFWGTVERLQADMQMIYQRLEMGTCPIFPQSRRREELGTHANDMRYIIHESKIDNAIRARILDLYAMDLQLYDRVLAGSAGY